MPRHAKGPRLYLRRGRKNSRTGKAVQDTLFIRDGEKEVSTGFRLEERAEAEKALAAYIDDKHDPGLANDPNRPRYPSEVLCADVIGLYAAERAPSVADPVSAAGRLDCLLRFWGDKTLADVRRSTCLAYVASRTAEPIRSFTKHKPRFVSAEGARRELEDLSAAIGYWIKEHPLIARPTVTLPEKAESPRDALTRSEAARLLKAARGYRFDLKSGEWTPISASGRSQRAHLRRFLLIGLYTGTRPGVIPKLLWIEAPQRDQAWVDLEAGAIYRKGRRERERRTKRRPMVLVPPRLLSHLRRWRAADVRDALACGTEPFATVIHRRGRALQGRLRTTFQACVRDAGLPPEVTPHWMRHTCATWLMQAGTDLWDAAGYTGMTVATLEKHYGHHHPRNREVGKRAFATGSRRA